MVDAARKELARLVSAYSARTGTPHREVHRQLRDACGGPTVAEASLEQVQHRVRVLAEHV